jgi:hypothetical protein
MTKKYSHKKRVGGSSSSNTKTKPFPTLGQLVKKRIMKSLKNKKQENKFKKEFPREFKIALDPKDPEFAKYRKKFSEIGVLIIPNGSREWNEIVDNDRFQTKFTKQLKDLFLKIEEKKAKLNQSSRNNSNNKAIEKLDTEIKTLEEEFEKLKIEKNKKDREIKEYLNEKKIDLVFRPFRIDPYLMNPTDNNKNPVSYLKEIEQLGPKDYPWWIKDYVDPSLQEQYFETSLHPEHRRTTAKLRKNKNIHFWQSVKPNSKNIKSLNLSSKLDENSLLVYEFFFDLNKHQILKDIELFPPEKKLHFKIMKKIKPGKTKKKGSSSSSSSSSLESVD